MKLTNVGKLRYIRLGDYIIKSTKNNRDLKYGEEYITGVNNTGVFASPRGNVGGVDLKPYKIVDTGAFVYNPSRLDLGSIAYRKNGLCIVSHLYQIFYLNDKGKKEINPEYLFMYFRRNEFYREVNFRNFGSQRPEFNLNDMSELVIPLPSMEIQKKYVDIFNSMVQNQQSYESGLEDLKISFDALIDRYKHTVKRIPVKNLLSEVDNRNSGGAITTLQGINISKQFMDSVANTTNVDLSKYKIVNNSQIAFSGMQTGRDKCIRIALSSYDYPIIISPAYTVFDITNFDIIPEYFMMWFSRDESDRYGWFISDSSIRSNLDLDRFYETEVPVPDKRIQKSIVEIYKAYIDRRRINETLKQQIKGICPILINGSIEEARRES